MEMTKDLDRAVAVLRSGGVIAHPADTCFGLAADLSNPDAIKKIQLLKGRDSNKPMSVMFPPSMRGQLARYVRLDDDSRHVCDRLLPGPVTIVLSKGPAIPEGFFPEQPSVGIRIPDDGEVIRLLEAFGGPIVTTSANLSGEEPCYDSQDLQVDADLVLEGKVVDPKPPSTVIKVDRGEITVLREGPLSLPEIKKKIGV